jgi:hypothetical protein
LQDLEPVRDFDVPIESRRELEESLIKLEVLIDEGHKLLSLLKFPASCDSCINNTPSNTVRMATSCTSIPSVLFGRDDDLDMIRKLLRDVPVDDKPSSSGTKCYSVIGIHGIPGSGKTTLAQYVCDKERGDGYFDLVMWVHVSQNFSVDTIFNDMLDIASGRKRSQCTNIDMLQWELEEKLRGKRFLLVLNDFQSDKDNRSQVDLLLPPLKVGEMGSRILVTTRTVDAAKAICAQNLVAISDLDEEQFFSMFMHYAVDGTEISDRELLRSHQSIGRKIAEKLGRSPLAARIVAGQLKARLDIDFWTRTMNNDMLNNGTMATLWWSYQQLEEHVKQCFTFCSIFPRTYKLQRDELVHLWMAEGFVKTTTETEDVENVGHHYFNMLLSTSFIQLKRNELNEEYFTIHDLLHDLAARVAGSDCFRIEKGMVGKIPKDVQHLFILSYDEMVFREEILNLKSLRTLIMSSCSNKSMDVEDFRSLLKNLKKLRVVLVQVDRSLSTISPCIGQQKHLRYLGLSGRIGIMTLPRRFTELYNLQKFAVGHTSSVDFHFNDEIANLVNLRYIICRVFDFPDIQSLVLLRTLPVFRVRNARGHEIQQLEHLDNLRGTLSIEGLENVRSKEEACQAKLYNKAHLSDLVLQWNSNNQNSNLMSDQDIAGGTGGQSSDSEEEILEALRPPSNIKSLKIKNYNGSTYPNWFSGEKGALENLQHLELSSCCVAPTISESFLHLRTLVISGCKWYTLPENMLFLTLLEKLVIMRCSNIPYLPLLPQSLKVLTLVRWGGSLLPENMECLKSLEVLTVDMCKNILSLPKLPLSLQKLRLRGASSLPEGIECLTSLEELALQNCDNILSLPSLPLSLKRLEIYNCNPSLTETCQADGHPNWQKIAHIKEQRISYCKHDFLI